MINAKSKSRCNRCGKITKRLWCEGDDLLCGDCADELEFKGLLARKMTQEEKENYQKKCPEVYL